MSDYVPVEYTSRHLIQVRVLLDLHVKKKVNDEIGKTRKENDSKSWTFLHLKF